MLDDIILGQIAIAGDDLFVTDQMFHIIHVALFEEPDLGADGAEIAPGAAPPDFKPAVGGGCIVAKHAVAVGRIGVLVGVDIVDVEIAVVIHIGDRTPAGVIHRNLDAAVALQGVLAGTVVQVDPPLVAGTRGEDVEIPVIIHVKNERCEAPLFDDHIRTDILEITLAVVLQDADIGPGLIDIDDEGIEVAIVVIIGEGGTVDVVALGEHAALADVRLGEIAIAVVDEEVIGGRGWPASPEGLAEGVDP
ncbi:MAG: hypothetical protein BWY77_00303 [bacterium ADurb.Bin431]|nr:MAG: hypothetical protein BWY77_00303 [bacterium ADurb.Bin431]